MTIQGRGRAGFSGQTSPPGSHPTPALWLAKGEARVRKSCAPEVRWWGVRGVPRSLLWEGGGLQRGGRAKEEGGRRNQLGQAGGLGVGEREEEGSKGSRS